MHKCDVHVRARMDEVEADEIFLLMTDKYRISRDTRAAWYFSHLNNFVSLDNEEDEDLKIISIIGDVKQIENEDGIAVPDTHNYKVVPNTRVTFLAKTYRLVFILDISPSIASADTRQPCVLLDEAFKAFSSALRGIMQPMSLPGYSSTLNLKPHVTVIAHTSLIYCKAKQVLLHGCQLHEDNLESVLEQVRQGLEDFELSVASAMSDVVQRDMTEDEEDQKLTGGLFEDILDRPDSPKPDLFMMSADTNFVNIIRYGILALQLLPDDCCAGIVVITDGVVGAPEASLFESLLNQLRHNMISCSFLLIGSGFSLAGGLGHVPNTDIMQFIASTTFGSLLQQLPNQETENLSANLNFFHKTLITWSFHKPMETCVDDIKMLSISGMWAEVKRDLFGDISFSQMKLNDKNMWSTHLVKKKYLECNLQTSISSIISCRLREGYTVQDITFSKGESQIEIHLILPWRDGIKIHYFVSGAWPFTATKKLSHVEVTIEACYQFLRDISLKKSFKNSFRNAVMKKYWQTLQGMSETDQLLVHLQSLSSNSANFLVPESLKHGVPLFEWNSSKNVPEVNAQFGVKDTAVTQFAAFWKPVLMLDINIWQKWLHTHRIGVIIEHDEPLGKHLHIPNSSGRFHSVLCRQGLESLNVFLQDWCSFILMENHSYIKLLYNDTEKTPVSFYVLRVASKAPCLVLRVAFLVGTEGQRRYEILDQLRNHLSLLTFQERGGTKQDAGKNVRPRLEEKSTGKERKPPLQRLRSEKKCGTLTRKPLEKIVIRYSRIPQDFCTLELVPRMELPGQLAPIVSANRIAANTFTTLSHYLYHQRWVWSVQHGSSIPISMHAIGQILSTLTSIRLQEGFHFAQANSGIVNLAIEVDMKESELQDSSSEVVVQPCILQYIVFPPHSTTTKESISEEEPEAMETTEADGELQIITECWIEPQYGTVVNSTPEREHFDGLHFHQLAHAIYPTDLECISTIITFEHLNLMCQNLTVPSPVSTGSAPPSSFPNLDGPPTFPVHQPDNNIQVIPFPFDLMKLLPKCQQVEILFSTFIQEPEDLSASRRGTLTDTFPPFESPSPNKFLFNLFLNSLKAAHDREIYLTDYECEQLVSLIQQRERDLNKYPLPFNYVSNYSSNTMSIVDKHSLHCGRQSLSTLSLNTTMSVNSAMNLQSHPASHSISSRAGPIPSLHLSQKSAATSGQSTRVTSPFEPQYKREHDQDSQVSAPHSHGVNRSLDDTAYSRAIPRWRCFVKCVAGNNVLLCFVPSSTIDLALLQQTIDHQQSDVQTEPSDRSRHPTDEVDKSATADLTSVLERPVMVTPDSPEDIQRDKSESEDRVTLPSDRVTLPSDNQNSSVASESQGKSCAMDDSLPSLNNQTSSKLPVYIYNCSLSFLRDQLVDKWTFKRPDDIFQDLSTEMDDVSFDERQRIRTRSGDSSGGRDREALNDTVHGSRGRRRVDTSPQDVFGSQEDVEQHCTLVSEIYFREFATGVFQGLQTGCDISSHDVDTAVNRICEEHLPIEIDITKYIHSVCGHIQKKIERAKQQFIVMEDVMKTFPKPIDKDQKPENENHCSSKLLSESKESPDSPDILHELKFPLSLLMGNKSCEQIESLHQYIKKAFDEVMSESFKSIPSSPDYYFYNLATVDSTELHLSGDGLINFENVTETTLEPSDRAFQIRNQQDINDNPSEHDTVESVKDSSNGSSLDLLDDLDQAESEKEQHGSPLFLTLMCSVRSKDIEITSMTVRNLPTCLRELRECLGGQTEVDLEELQITLDIICLTLPDFDQQVASRPCYSRVLSYTSQISHSSMSPPTSAGVYGEPPFSTMNVIVNEDFRFPHNALMDQLKYLPEAQKEAFVSCHEGIEWLLRDEIASALRIIAPVEADTLEMVASHVKSSDDKTKCIVHQVPLRFVFGPDQSLIHFIEAFEGMKLNGFGLKKAGVYYYLYMDQAQVNFMVHAQAISSALSECLDGNDANTNLTSALSLCPNYRDVRNSNLAASKTEKKDDGGSVYDTHGEVENDKDGDDVHDTSIEVIEEDHNNPPEDHLLEDIESATFTAEDIKISVTRPSPMKEAAKWSSQSSEDVQTDKKGGSISSASSIQVLDETERDTDPKDESTLDSVRSPTSKPVAPGQFGTETSMLGGTASVSADDVLNKTHASVPEADRQLLRHVQSTPCVERYRFDRAASVISKSGHNTPQRRTSGPQTPLRSRHHSGAGVHTPLSTCSFLDTSSRSSMGEEGYEPDGGEDSEEEEPMSFNESMIFRPSVPDFWLIMSIVKDKVDVFFHTRNMAVDQSEEISQSQMTLYNKVINIITEKCKMVNQKLLLEDLYRTRMCNKLLVGEADEDVNWTDDKFLSPSQRRKLEDSDSDGEAPQHSYLQAMTEFKPGHFECDRVWQTHFSIHPRLHTATVGSSVDKGVKAGVKALRQVLNKFSVNNRSNMFVVREKNGSVFYLRLNELTDVQKLESTPNTPESYTSYKEEDFISPAPPRKFSEAEENLSLTNRLPVPSDIDSASVSSRAKYKGEEQITLSAHGIGPVGDEVSQELVLMLQRKLDEAVLEILTVTLARNPMCKLSHQDCEFIQKPQSLPTENLQLTIPSCALLHQYALRYYLRQNLLTFLFTPKYMDSKVMFFDYKQASPAPIPEADTFLYKRQAQAGDKGIALIQLLFIDGKGNPLLIFNNPRPTADAYKDTVESSMFESMVAASTYNLIKTKGPGVMSMIQFNIWENGAVGRLTLMENLLKAVQHAACDVFMEYRLLTAPICQVPFHYERGLDSPMHSAPSSPAMLHRTDVADATPSDWPKKKLTDSNTSGTFTPKERASFSIQTFVSDVFKPKKEQKISIEDSSTSTALTWQEVEAQNRQENELQEKRQKYEEGERGDLHPIFVNIVNEWLHFCVTMDCPSVYKTEFTLQSRFPLDYVLKEFTNIINSICNDMVPRVFRIQDGTPDQEGPYVPYVAGRPHASEKSPSSLLLGHHCSTCLPGTPMYYIGIARNMRQWRSSIDYGYTQSSQNMSLLNPKTNKNYQKFNPHAASISKDVDTPESMKTTGFIPRQRLLYMRTDDKEITVYTYNWAPDMNSSLTRKLNKLVLWHNARSQLLDCIISQKMGLFHHVSLSGPTQQQGSNPFTESTGDIDYIIKYTAPPLQEPHQRNRAGTTPRTMPHLHGGGQMYKHMYMYNVFMDKKPPYPMYKQHKYNRMRDPLHKHGAQFLDVKSLGKKEMDRTMGLTNIYMMWQDRTCAHPMPISEDMLDMLKSLSRLLHNVATPLLFHAQWRRRVMGRPESTLRPDNQTDAKPRSRHSSGASIKSRRSDSQEAKKLRASFDQLESSVWQHSEEESWHVELRNDFLSEYIHYLKKNLGFAVVRVNQASPRRSKLHDGNGGEINSCNQVTSLTYLQKTLPGGIMLVELGFREAYFFVHEYAFECSRIPAGKNVNRPLCVIFTDECDGFKDQTRIHSFSHDFHLRKIHAYVSQQQTQIFKQGYHLTAFLHDFVKHFPYSPKFARSYVYEDTLVVSNINSPGKQIAEYMWTNHKTYNMRAMRVLPHHDDFDEETLDSDYALVMQSTMVADGDHQLDLLVCPDPWAVSASQEPDRMSLHLRYWLLLTHQQDVLPNQKVERAMGMSKSSSNTLYPAKLGWFREDDDKREVDVSTSASSHMSLKPEPQSTTPGPEIVKYLGHSNSHQTPIYNMLMREAVKAKEKIQILVDTVIAHYRRDFLWNRMLLGTVTEETGRRKHHSAEEERDPVTVKLSFAEFEELLKAVTRRRLSEVDPQLAALEHMSLAWHQGLLKLLRNRYIGYHRLFTSNDGSVQYLVLLNPNYVEAFMLLSIDMMTNKTELCGVYREVEQSQEQNWATLNTQTFLEQFVNTCCFHLWSGMV